LGLSLLDLLNEVSFETQSAEALVVDLPASTRSVTAITPVRATEFSLAVAA